MLGISFRARFNPYAYQPASIEKKLPVWPVYEPGEEVMPLSRTPIVASNVMHFSGVRNALHHVRDASEHKLHPKPPDNPTHGEHDAEAAATVDCEGHLRWSDGSRIKDAHGRDVTEP